MPEESRLVYQVAIILALIIFICTIPPVCADESNVSIVSATINETALNETFTVSTTETVPFETTIQKPDKLTPEPTIFTTATTLNNPSMDQTSDIVPMARTKRSSIDQDSLNHIQINFETRNITQYVAKDISSNASKDISLSGKLSAYGVQNSEELRLPSPELVTKYDFVTVDNKLLNEQLKAGKGITISIGGTDYPAELSRMNFENFDDGVDSYHGTLMGTKFSEILFTTSEKVLVGRITLDNETYWITPVESGENIANNQSPLHIIYNSDEVTDKKFMLGRNA